MATSLFSSFSSFPIFLFLLSLTPVAFASLPSSSIASDQIDFWSKNVINSMPEAIVSKLSSLSKQDSASLASSISKPAIYSESKFCSMANLACAALQRAIIPPAKVYNHYAFVKRTAHRQDKIDVNSFFRLSILKSDNKVQLPNLDDQYPSRSFLPAKIGSEISTTTSADVRKLFPSSLTSLASKEALEMSISYCSSPSLKGEIKSCPNSLENMIEFSKKALGVSKLMALSSESAKWSKKVLEISNIKQLHAQKVVSCHEIFFPFATYFCHLLSSTRLYVVDFVEPTTKAPVNGIFAACHMDTSEWPADHVAFKILKSSPGRGEVCHWFTNVDLAWIGN